MKKSIFITVGLLAFTVLSIYAQNDFDEWRKRSKQDFDNFKIKSGQEFQNFRAKANVEYAEFMSRSWEEFQSFKGIPTPKFPDPVKPPKLEPEKKPTTERLPFEVITPTPTPTPQPQPIEPIHKPAPTIPEKPLPKPVKPGFSFQFYNTDCKVSLDNTLRFSLHDASEQSATQAWKILSENKYDVLISDCLTLRDQLNLSDWGYYLLLKDLSEKFFGKETNEAVLMQMFILTQSGYKVRIARTNNKLALLIPFRQIIYEHIYFNIDEVKYYVINKELNGQPFYICNQEFPKEQFFSWQTGQPKLAKKLTVPKPFASALYPEIHAMVQTNQNLIDFYNDYLLSSEFDLYTLAGLSETAKQTLYPALQRAIAGKSKTEAANMLLNFLQTAFAYQIDAQQFGYERPFFADENFFYPYNNCKDRAILYAILVKELLGLKVVLLLYPNHLSTAVHFTEDVSGDYLIINGEKFVVCDPTYIGANIGMAMDECKKENAKVITIW